ncbi:MAG: fumarylacetoacetate hydrolase family protein [Actinomycetaceae bacterium]|nr:fumarylacetoacetate hydrolase family protein [Actinomycetaceae bacterium]
MRILRFTHGSRTSFGLIESEDADKVIVLKSDSMFYNVEATGEVLDLADISLLAPVVPPSKVACVGKNYADHIKEMGGKTPDAPIIFIKPNTAIIGPGEAIVLPQWSDEVHHEVELAIVIKTFAKNVAAKDYRDYILGYTIGNDVSARDAQRQDGQWTRAKSFDTSCPLGPWITVDPGLDVSDLKIRSFVDGELRQEDTTANMMVGVPELVAYVSSCFTLLPGDVILTGTPAGVGPIEAGQTCSVEIEGIGRMDNPVIRI